MDRLFRIVLATVPAGAIVAAFLGGLAIALAASIGGPFQLVDHTGRTVTEKSFDGRHLLVFFGYTYCPDFCPTELAIMGHAMDELGKLGNEVQPLFITVDPARDDVAALAEYVPSFHPRLLGLTGSKEQVRAAAKAYRVYYRLNESDEDGAYLVDHSTFVYFMDPDGNYVTHFRFGQEPEKTAAIIRDHID